MRDLRVSVTDRCNFRCDYCLPQCAADSAAFMPQDQWLTFEKIIDVVKAAVSLGVRKVRLTGGEPLLRPGLEALVRDLAGLEGLDDLALTTNGSLLAARARGLKAAGLGRLTVSLDSMDPDKTAGQSGDLETVLTGLREAQAAYFFTYLFTSGNSNFSGRG